MSFPFFRAEVFSVRAHGSYGVFAVDVSSFLSAHDLLCSPVREVDPDPEVRLRQAHQDDLVRAQDLLGLAREMTQSAHDLADPYVRYSAARRQFLQSRLQDVRLGLERLIDSLSPSESF
jgi:hypothetical protein